MLGNKICRHLDCQEKATYLEFCEFHFNGGVFGNGDTYQQYQIIEEDFLNFIKIVPIDDTTHLRVHSPILRDIIIRNCVQIEGFLKEWAKFLCNNPDSQLYKKYNIIDKKTGLTRGGRNWNFVDYYILLTNHIRLKKIFVRPMNEEIEPFKTWTKPKEYPKWWAIYNGIKHDGVNFKKEATLKVALESLGALFLMHCNNKHSKMYLEKFVRNSVTKRGADFLLTFGHISSPLDTKKYLFRESRLSPQSV